MSASNGATTLERVLGPSGEPMPEEVARWLISLHADDDLQYRVDELADKNTEGVITPAELAEYDEYLRIADFIAVLKAKARAALVGTSRRLQPLSFDAS